MLGQHPECYGFPELNLFVADTVDQMLRAYRFAGDQARHGLLRALAQVHEGEQTEASVERAEQWLAARTSWSTGAVFDHLLEQVAPQIGVDKSPRTVMKPEYLERLLHNYPGAHYLHLIRHPRTTGESQIKITQRSHEWGGRVDATRINPDRWWLRAQSAILRFKGSLRDDQVMQIRGEDLLSDPYRYLPQLTEWLGLRTDTEAIEAMLHPEHSPYACLGPSNARYGNDINFLERPHFRASTIPEASLNGPLSWAPSRELSDEIKRTARLYGYR